jgi:fibronectin-binding autotransporter adhesin
MKPSFRNPLLRSLALTATICLSFASLAHSADLFWDANGEDSTAVGGTGNWSATAWRTGSTTGTLGAWSDNNRPVFQTTVGIVTLDQNIAADGINFIVANNEIRGSGTNTITFAGGNITSATGGQDITALLAGSVVFNPTAGALNTASTFNVRANNTGLTSVQLNATGSAPANANMIIDSSGALGPGGPSPSTVTLTNGILNIGALTTEFIGSSTANGSGGGLSLNAWTTTLAGGTIRSRAGANTWNGPTTLTANSGLMTRGASDVVLTFSNTATIDLGAFTLTSSSDLSSGGVRLQGNISGTGGKIATGNFAGGGSINAGGSTILSGTNTYTGGTDVNFGSLVFLNTASKPATGTITVAAGATLGLGVGTSPTHFTEADINSLFAGTFGATLNATSNVGLDTTAGDFAYGGSSGAVTYGLSKLGANRLTLTAANAYTGPTNVFAGTLALSGTGTFGSGALTLNGGTVDLGGQSVNIGALSVVRAAASGETITAGSLTTSGTTATSYAVSNASGNAIIAASLLANSTAGLTKTGAGNLLLSGANTYTGGTTVSAGNISFLRTASIPATGTVAVPAASTIGLGVGTSPTFFSGTDVLALLAGTLTNVSGATAYTVGIDTTAGNFDLSENIGTSTRAIVKQGINTLTLSGNNTYDRLITVGEGTLRAGSTTAFNNTGTLAVLPGTTFDLNGNPARFISISNNTGTITTSGAGTDTDTLTISALAAQTGTLFTDGATRKLALNISGVSGTLDALSNAASTFSGGLTLTTNIRAGAANNSVASGGRFGRGTITIGAAAGSLAQLYYTTNNVTIDNPFVVNTAASVGSRTGAFRVDSTGNTLSGQITAALANAVFINGSATNGSITLSGQVTGANGLQANAASPTNPLTLTLSNVGTANDYVGSTSVGANATLALGAANQIPHTSGTNNLAVAGTLNLNVFSETIGGLTGAGIIDNLTNSASGTTNTLTLGANNAPTPTFSGSIRNTNGTLALTKIGSGTQTLSGANEFIGATTVSGGTLRLGLASALATTPTITVDSGAFLDVSTITWSLGSGQSLRGNGTISGASTLAGTVAPGSGVGTLNLNGNTTLTGTYACEVVSATADGLAVTGNLDITGATLNLSTVTPTPGTYTIATYSGALTGTFTPSPALPSGYVLDYSTTGQVRLTVPNTTSPYVTWGTPFGLAAGSEGGDLDNDGLSNFEEFAFGLTPNSGSSVNPITAQLNKTTGQFTYQRLAGSGLTYSIWTSENLITWTEDTTAIQTPTPAGANESVAVTLSATPKPLTASRLFIRVRAN